ncbi:hypothetical protein [Paenibacillus sp. FSL K6-2862]|uniref:hypothetical protein n=1 Tax=Paenibacillus sp. FSL K6-2862 TaxID=2921484 RepID=UPI0030F7665B
MDNVLECIQKYFNQINNFEFPPSWNSHQNELKKIIGVSEFFDENFNRSLIFGAGNLYDLPIHDILENYKTTDLLDIDVSTIEKALKKINEDPSRRINIITKDIVNYPEEISQLESPAFVENVKEVKELLDRLLTADLCSVRDFQFSYSLVISSTVSSQLILPISSIIDHSINDELIVLTKKLGDTLAEKHVTQVWDLLEKGGIGIITSEQYAWGSINNSPLPLTKAINAPTQMLDAGIQNQIELIQGGLVINGRVTPKIISDYIPHNNILNESQWIWQFDNELFYLVKSWVFIKE